MVAGCKECAAVLRGSSEKALKKRRRQHAALHLHALLYIKTITDRVNMGASPSLGDHLQQLTELLARDVHREFSLYMRFQFDDNRVWDRLRVAQKGHFEWLLKKQWDSLDDKDKEAFLRVARELVEAMFPEAKP
jgi:hypothetical protein